MLHDDAHLSDQELILAADGELNSRRREQVHAHLAACWECRTRLRGLESAIADFVHFRSDALDPRLPPVAGRRALLKARLADIAPQSSSHRRRLGAQGTLAFGLAVAVVLALYVVLPQRAAAPIPRRQLTPGAVRSVAKSDVCAVNTRQPVMVPVSLQRRVFEEYGLRNVQPSAYEVDYLITPELGGASDIRNLWPEPYSATVWNARVKDELEERLHQMVCDGQLDLSTAQHDIATDWIAAYKKYFNSSRPRQN
jgi:hypothetical protein